MLAELGEIFEELLEDQRGWQLTALAPGLIQQLPAPALVELLENSSVPPCPSWIHYFCTSVVTSPKFTHEIIQFLFCLYASLGSIIAAAAEITKSALRPPA